VARGRSSSSARRRRREKNRPSSRRLAIQNANNARPLSARRCCETPHGGRVVCPTDAARPTRRARHASEPRRASARARRFRRKTNSPPTGPRNESSFLRRPARRENEGILAVPHIAHRTSRYGVCRGVCLAGLVRRTSDGQKYASPSASSVLWLFHSAHVSRLA
jgi:hypothetical protein